MFEKLKQIKEAKVKEKQTKENIERLRVIIKNSFYPWLKENTSNIEEASVLCQVLAGYIHSGFNALVDKIMIADLELDKFITKDEDKKKYTEALAMMQYESVKDALMCFEGMPKAIGACVNKELKGRKLSELTELEKDFS